MRVRELLEGALWLMLATTVLGYLIVHSSVGF
jgi:hypothetical protein